MPGFTPGFFLLFPCLSAYQEVEVRREEDIKKPRLQMLLLYSYQGVEVLL
jgi:hypothetical protein